jgi:hypothetical protein
MSMRPDQIVAQLAVSVDSTLARQLIDEAVSLEDAFALRRWKYTELDGGRFAEVAARIVYAADSDNVSLTKSVDDCLRYIDNQQVAHNFPQPQSAIHLGKILRAIYKLRSQRGAVHVSPTYTANEIDSRLILEAARWALAEILRVLGGIPQEELAEIVHSLSRFPQPLMRIYGETALLQSTTFTTEEEVLAHLLFADSGMTQRELISVVPKDASGVRRAIAKLVDPKQRQVVLRSGAYLITDLGITRIEQKIADETRGTQ